METWVHSSPMAALPPFAVIGGHDCDGAPMYVGRAFHDGDNLPAKVIPSKGSAYVCYGGLEHMKNHYEVLVGQGYAWVPCYGGNVPPNAVRSGITRGGEPLYVGRGHHANSLTVGKIHPSHGCLYIPFGGQEIRINSYEVLIRNADQWVASTPNYTPPGAVVAGHDTDKAIIYVGRALHEEHKWVHSSAYSSIPENAVVAGNDADGDMVYVGRSFHNGDRLVASVIPSKTKAFVSWRGEVIEKAHFEVLCGRSCIWVHCYDHAIPENAILCGKTELQQPVYIGRGWYEGCLCVGKVSSVHRALFIAFNGLERRLESYEILVEEQCNVKAEEAGWSNEMLSATPTPPPPPFETLEQKMPAFPPAGVTPYPPPTPFDNKATLYAPPVPQPMPMPPVMPMPMPTPMPAYGSAASMCGPPPPYATIGSCPTPQEMLLMSSAPAPPPPTHMQLPTTTPATVYAGAAPRHDMWMTANHGYTPGNALRAGYDVDNSPIMLCRAFHNGDLVPGKLVAARNCAYVSFSGQEIPKSNYEVLVGNQQYMWIASQDGNILPGAVEAGRTRNGETLYVGRAFHCGSLTPGKIQRSHQCLYIAFGGAERRITNYEVLVRKDDYYRDQSIKLCY